MAGWIGVDLDGCLAEYHGWDDGKIGRPIPAMVARVEKWLAEGIEVRIFTARINRCGRKSEESGMLADLEFAIEQGLAIEAWCREHLGRVLTITDRKDFEMVALWDDRCVPVEKNTGRRLDGLED